MLCQSESACLHKKVFKWLKYLHKRQSTHTNVQSCPSNKKRELRIEKGKRTASESDSEVGLELGTAQFTLNRLGRLCASTLTTTFAACTHT